MIEAVLSIKSPEWVSDISEKYTANIKILGCVPFAEGGVRDLVELRASKEDIEGVMQELKTHPHFTEVDVSPTGRGRALASISTDQCGLCSAIAKSECFLISASTKEDRIQWTVLASDKGPLKNLVSGMTDAGFGVDIIRVTDVRTKEALTARQEEIIRIALEKGYFDFPKKTSIRELSHLFGISISTLSEILRAGQKKILASYFSEK